MPARRDIPPFNREDGTILLINAKSGHYKPTIDSIRLLVRKISEIPNDAIIMPEFVSSPTPAYWLADFWNSAVPPSVKRADVLNKLPAWARNTKSDAMINQVSA